VAARVINPNQQPIIFIANPAVVNTLAMPDDGLVKTGLGIFNHEPRGFQTSRI
jgi:hypothetical protein